MGKPLTENQQNILRVLERADVVDVREGLVAYERYHATLDAFAHYYSTPLRQAIAAFVALSPNNDYTGNLKSLATLMHGRIIGATLDQCTVTTYRACAQRAWMFLHGAQDFLATTKGAKTRAFYLNILEPHLAGPVTIDGHMIGLWLGRRLRMREAETIQTRRQYEAIAHDFRLIARRQRIMPHQLQGILWFTWKRLHDVRAVQNWDAFAGDDQWGLLRRPESVQPLPIKPTLDRGKRADVSSK